MWIRYDVSTGMYLCMEQHSMHSPYVRKRDPGYMMNLRKTFLGPFQCAHKDPILSEVDEPPAGLSSVLQVLRHPVA